MASQGRSSHRPKPPVPIKSKVVLAFTKQQLQQSSRQPEAPRLYHSDSESIDEYTESDIYDDILPYRSAIVAKPSQDLQLKSTTESEKKELKKKPKPKPRPKPTMLLQTSKEDIYDDVVVYRMRAALIKPPVAPRVKHLQTAPKAQQTQTSYSRSRVQTGIDPTGESGQDKEMYTDASSLKPKSTLQSVNPKSVAKPPVAPKPSHLQTIENQPISRSESPLRDSINASVSIEESSDDEGIYADASSLKPEVVSQDNQPPLMTNSPTLDQQVHQTQTYLELSRGKYVNIPPNLEFSKGEYINIPPSINSGNELDKSFTEDEVFYEIDDTEGISPSPITRNPERLVEQSKPIILSPKVHRSPKQLNSVSSIDYEQPYNTLRANSLDNDNTEGVSPNSPVTRNPERVVKQSKPIILPPKVHRSPEQLNSKSAFDYEQPYNKLRAKSLNDNETKGVHSSPVTKNPERVVKQSNPIILTPKVHKSPEQLNSESVFDYEQPYNTPGVDNYFAQSHDSTLNDNACIQSPRSAPVGTAKHQMSEDYDYPELNPLAKDERRLEPVRAQLRYDYTNHSLSLTPADSASSAHTLPSQGVFATREYDYAYQQPPSPHSLKAQGIQIVPAPNNEYAFIDSYDSGSIGSPTQLAVSPSSKSSQRVENAPHHGDSKCSDSRQLLSPSDLQKVQVLPNRSQMNSTPQAGLIGSPRIKVLPTIQLERADDVRAAMQQSSKKPFHSTPFKSYSLPRNRSKFDPLPDLFDRSRVPSEGDLDYENDSMYETIDHKAEQSCKKFEDDQVNVSEVPKKIRNRTTRLVRGPTKKKLHQTIKMRKFTNLARSSSMNSIDSSLTESNKKENDKWVLVPYEERTATKDQTAESLSCDSDDDFQSIPSGKSQEVFEMLLEASGIHRPLKQVHRHSLDLTSSAELQRSATHQFLETTEFENLRDMVYDEFKDYKAAGIIHVRPRAQIADEIKRLTENASSSPPPLPDRAHTTRPRLRPIAPVDGFLNQRLHCRLSASTSSLEI